MLHVDYPTVAYHHNDLYCKTMHCLFVCAHTSMRVLLILKNWEADKNLHTSYTANICL